MKYTYIFLATDPEMSNHRLRKLVNALRLTTTVSWKYAGNADMLTEVQCFVDGPTVYHLLSSAGVDSDAWDSIIKAARRNGDVATGRAESKLNALRTPVRIEGPTLWMSVALDRLRKAGCDIKVYLIPPMSYEIVVFGEIFTLESSSEARGFLAGLEKGLASPPIQMPGGTKRSKRSA